MCIESACCRLPWALSPRPLTQTRPGGQTLTGWTHPCAACGPLVPEQLAGRGRPLLPQPLPRKNNKPPSAPCGGGHWGTVGPAGSLPELRSPPSPGGCGVGLGVAGAWAAGRHSWATVSWTLWKVVSAVPPLKWGPRSLVLSVRHPCIPGSQRGHRSGRPWRRGEVDRWSVTPTRGAGAWGEPGAGGFKTLCGYSNQLCGCQRDK